MILGRPLFIFGRRIYAEPNHPVERKIRPINEPSPDERSDIRNLPLGVILFMSLGSMFATRYPPRAKARDNLVTAKPAGFVRG